MDASELPRNYLAGDRINIAGRSMSAEQYRWLFPDLAQNLPDGDRAAITHFEFAGQHELTDGRRIAPETRLVEIQLQQFSPVAPDAEKSANFAFRAGTSDTLDIYFSYPVPADMFVPQVPATESANARLHVKETTHSYFQRGVPGITTSIEETAQWLERILEWLQPRRLRIFGPSAGGYAALVFGHLLSADVVVAIAPEVMLGKQFYRSRKWFPNAVYNPSFRDVTPMVHGLSERLALIYPVYDPLDYEMIRLCREQHPLNLAYMPTFHPGLAGIDIGAFARSQSEMPALSEIVMRQYDFRYDDATIAMVIRAYELLMNRDYAASLPILRDVYAADPANFGLLLHIGFQQALLGERDKALATLRLALDGIATAHDHAELGQTSRRGSRAPVRYYYDANRKMIASLERLWDEAIGDAG